MNDYTSNDIKWEVDGDIYIYMYVYIYIWDGDRIGLPGDGEREVSNMAGWENHRTFEFVDSPASHDDTKWYPNLPSGKRTKNYGKSQFSMGK